MNKQKELITEIIINQNGSKCVDVGTKDSFNLTFFTEKGMFTIAYKQWKEEKEKDKCLIL